MRVALPHSLERGYGDADGEIETSRLGPHGNAKTTIRVVVEQRDGQTLRLAAEHEHVVGRERCFGVRPGGALVKSQRRWTICSITAPVALSDARVGGAAGGFARWRWHSSGEWRSLRG